MGQFTSYGPSYLNTRNMKTRNIIAVEGHSNLPTINRSPNWPWQIMSCVWRYPLGQTYWWGVLISGVIVRLFGMAKCTRCLHTRFLSCCNSYCIAKLNFSQTWQLYFTPLQAKCKSKAEGAVLNGAPPQPGVSHVLLTHTFLGTWGQHWHHFAPNSPLGRYGEDSVTMGNRDMWRVV